MSTQGRADWNRYAPDLYEDTCMRAISRAVRSVGTGQSRLARTGRLAGHGNARRGGNA